jgi:hypothetical protein
MAVAKIIADKDIIYGGSVNQPNAANLENNVYAPADRIIDVGDGSTLTFFERANSLYRGDKWLHQQGSIPAVSGDNASADGADATVDYPAVPYLAHSIHGIAWGYNSNPTGGALQVESPSGTIIWGPIPVTSEGTGFEDFGKGLRGVTGDDMWIRLVSGGSGVTGYVSVKGHREE